MKKDYDASVVEIGTLYTTLVNKDTYNNVLL